MIKTLDSSVKYWYLFILLGLLLIGGGIITFTFPLATYITIAILFAYFFVIEGISEVIFSIVNRKKMKGWGWTLLYGLFSIIIGVILILNPHISVNTMPLYYGILFLTKSIIGISLAISIHKETGAGHALIGIGVTGIIISTMLIVNPFFAGFTILFSTGMTLVISGVYSSALGLEFRKLKREISVEAEDTNVVEIKDLSSNIQEKDIEHS
ncbi:DUF308 domain-containing protein [Flammeovirga sp. SubArs3]|uniref:HdeD family acid-resistance protein n=1 Tax=Flammeovirga sp. SubArs3 TaxID=2995316 RepID=UPI00248B5933|nr:DUF308 domain-containing protein [Flammeovirga sp. SubArs3]